MTNLFRNIRDAYIKIVVRKNYVLLITPLISCVFGVIIVTDIFISIFRERTQGDYMIDKDVLNIFFIHGRNSKFDHKEICAIESTAKTNPEWDIHILFIDHEDQNKHKLAEVREAHSNVYFGLVNSTIVTEKTPFIHIVKRMPTFLSDNPDALKFLMLLHFGGIYLDSDFIVMKSFSELNPNWAVKLDDDHFTTAAIGTSIPMNLWGTHFLLIAVGQYVSTYKELTHKAKLHNKPVESVDFRNIGDGVLKRTLQQYCLTHNIHEMSHETCSGFELYNNSRFIISSKDVYKYLKNLNINNFMQSNVQLVRMRIDKNNNEVDDAILKEKYPILAKRYCPIALKMFGNKTFS